MHELDMKKAIAKDLKVARVIKELTQEELAKKLRKPRSFVQKYESCERRLDVAEFISVCKALDADLHEIIDKLKR